MHVIKIIHKRNLKNKYNPSKPEWTFLTKKCCSHLGESMKTVLYPSKIGLRIVQSSKNICMLQQYKQGLTYLFLSVVVKSYPFATLFWVNKDENIWSNKISLPIGKYISHSCWKQIDCLRLYDPNRIYFCLNSAIIMVE